MIIFKFGKAFLAIILTFALVLSSCPSPSTSGSTDLEAHTELSINRSEKKITLAFNAMIAEILEEGNIKLFEENIELKRPTDYSIRLNDEGKIEFQLVNELKIGKTYSVELLAGAVRDADNKKNLATDKTAKPKVTVIVIPKLAEKNALTLNTIQKTITVDFNFDIDSFDKAKISLFKNDETEAIDPESIEISSGDIVITLKQIEPGATYRISLAENAVKLGVTGNQALERENSPTVKVDAFILKSIAIEKSEKKITFTFSQTLTAIDDTKIKLKLGESEHNNFSVELVDGKAVITINDMGETDVYTAIFEAGALGTSTFSNPLLNTGPIDTTLPGLKEGSVQLSFDFTDATKLFVSLNRQVESLNSANVTVSTQAAGASTFTDLATDKYSVRLNDGKQEVEIEFKENVASGNQYKVTLRQNALNAPYGLSNPSDETSEAATVPNDPKLKELYPRRNLGDIELIFNKQLDSIDDSAKIIVFKTPVGGAKATLPSGEYTLSIKNTDKTRLVISLETDPVVGEQYGITIKSGALIDAKGVKNQRLESNPYTVSIFKPALDKVEVDIEYRNAINQFQFTFSSNLSEVDPSKIIAKHKITYFDTDFTEIKLNISAITLKEAVDGQTNTVLIETNNTQSIKLYTFEFQKGALTRDSEPIELNENVIESDIIDISLPELKNNGKSISFNAPRQMIVGLDRSVESIKSDYIEVYKNSGSGFNKVDGSNYSVSLINEKTALGIDFTAELREGDSYYVKLLSGALTVYGITNEVLTSLEKLFSLNVVLATKNLVLKDNILSAEFDRELTAITDKTKITVSKTPSGTTTMGSLTLSTDYSLAIRDTDRSFLDITLVEAPVAGDKFKIEFQAGAVGEEPNTNTRLLETYEYSVKYQWVKVLDLELNTDSTRWSRRNKHTTVVFNDKIWILGGYGKSESDELKLLNDVWWSEDGKTWTNANASDHWSPRDNHTSVVFDGKIWVMGGYGGSIKNDIWYSEDGSVWNEVTAAGDWTAARTEHTSVVFKGNIYVMGGRTGSVYSNDVLRSADGITWKKLDAKDHWDTRSGHASVVLGDNIYVIGGQSIAAMGEVSDVWSSSDGINWNEIASSSSWIKRDTVSAGSYLGKIWVLGGPNNYPTKEVWSSADGIKWTSESNDLWTEKVTVETVVFKNRLWVLGGKGNYRRHDTSTIYKFSYNDVWFYGLP